MHNLGIVSPSLQAVHMTRLHDDEIELVARNGVQVAHCPESNLKLASGLCPVDRLRRAGVNVAVGTDGAASNNDLDLIQETRTASLLAKGVSGDATSVNATDALEMMTINGARFLGLEDEIGSLEPGKQADIVAVDLNALSFQPIYNPVSQLIYNASGTNVSHVWIKGVRQLAEGELCNADEASIRAGTERWRKDIKGLTPSTSGITA